VGHLRQAGFTTKVQDLGTLRPIKEKYGVPADLQACHTGLVDGYVIEGHVPADLIIRLLSERPPVAGLAVRGMPVGSPGMEVPGSPTDRYEVFAFEQSGKTTVFASR